MLDEQILQVLPAHCDNERLVIVLSSKDGHSELVLRQESHSDDVGWFVQSRVVIQPEQFAGLKASITGNQVRRLPKRQPVPTILSFADALAAG